MTAYFGIVPSVSMDTKEQKGILSSSFSPSRAEETEWWQPGSQKFSLTQTTLSSRTGYQIF